jgi:L,D-peptidoglycan transpeptidase YkuD (ErfK/YbiS/YcfS/YnhG family)
VTSLRRIVREALRLAPWGLLLFVGGCSAGTPGEAILADLQERRLWRAEAETFAPDDYRAYRQVLRRAKDHLISAEGRLLGFRERDAIAGEFREVMARGEALAKAVGERREQRRGDLEHRLEEQRAKVNRLATLTTLISCGKSYQEVSSRKFLAQADVLTSEAALLYGKGQYDAVEERLKSAGAFAQIAKEAITPALKRFVDRDQITTWRTRVAETIRESKIAESYAIVVSKVDRTLVLYKGGRPVKTYAVGLGAGSIRDKVCAGDRATPEGKYRIVRKMPQSKYYKALLINYPNEDDQRQFAELKRQGALSRRAGIGGMIEIHGGGKDGMTFGCVALDDRHMEELFVLAEVGTPVTIVGATDYENSVTEAMKGL